MEVRCDTYLWAVRMFKSRTLAGDAIRAGKVKVNGESLKPSRSVKIGDLFAIAAPVDRVIEVSGITDKRGPFAVAQKFYVDKTPASAKQPSMEDMFFKSVVRREKGSGRPTKKDRRDIDSASGDWL